MLSGPETVFVGLLASVTVTVILEVPTKVGVPLMTHPASESPAGSVPVVIEQL